jgi:hypothetical protein
LNPLTRLRQLHLGVYLSNEALFHTHLLHGLVIPRAPATFKHNIFHELELREFDSNESFPSSLPALDISTLAEDLGAIISGKPYLPSDCVVCSSLASLRTTTDELIASAVLARHLPALEDVSWSSFFAAVVGPERSVDSGASVWEERERARIRVERTGKGEIRVRRVCEP